MNCDRRARGLPFLLCALVLTGLGATPADPGFELDGVTFVSSRKAMNEIVLEAVRARFAPHARIVYLSDVDARVTGGPGGARFDMTCDRGEYHLESGDFVAIGSVRGRTHEGRRFATTRLRYVHDLGLVTTDSPVTIHDEAGEFRGGGFRYYVREGRFRLLGGAQVRTQ